MDQFPYEFETSGITFTKVPWEIRWLNPGVVRDKQQSQPFDDEGVGVRNIDGHYYMHPVNLSAFALTRLDMYRTNGSQQYLDLIIRQAERLIARAVSRENALYFPYPFPWHGGNQVATPMPVPWFSGMAQGYALALFSRLYEVIGEERYLEIAHRVFASYLLPRHEWLPWVTDLVEGRFLWFEEYANSRVASGSAMNGHVYAAFCLHDYWTVTGDDRAQTLADGGLTSALGLMDRWRRPGGMSYYGINRAKSTATYHHWHARQLGQVFNLTGDPLWVKLQDLFMHDYPTQSGPVEPHNATLIVKPGTYRVGVRGDLTVTDHVQAVIESERHMQLDTRARRYGETALSARVKEDDFLYMWFEEVPHQVYVSGIAEPMEWGHPVLHRVVETIDRFVRFDAIGEEVGSSAGNLVAGDTISVRGRGLIKGEVWLQVADDQYTDCWIPQQSVELIL